MSSLSFLDRFVDAYEEKRASKCLHDIYGKREPELEKYTFILRRRV